VNRPEGKGTKIFRTRDKTILSSLDHGVRVVLLPSLKARYSAQSRVGWSQGNSENIKNENTISDLIGTRSNATQNSSTSSVIILGATTSHAQSNY